jgi:uncharacterized repeat protein (TIGR01451 family)
MRKVICLVVVALLFLQALQVALIPVFAQETLDIQLRALPNPTRDIDGATILARVTSGGEPIEGAYVEFSFEPEASPHNGFDDDDDRDTPPVVEISGTTNELGEFQAHWGYYDVCIVSEQVITFHATASKEGYTPGSGSCTLNVLPLSEAPYPEPLYGEVTIAFPSGPHNVYVTLSPATGIITSGQTVYFDIQIGREIDYESIEELDWDAIWMIPVFKNEAGYLSEANTVTVSLPDTHEVQAEVIEDEVMVEVRHSLLSDDWIPISNVEDMGSIISMVDWLDRVHAISEGDWIGFGLGEIPDVISTLATKLYGEQLGHGPNGEPFDPSNENVELFPLAFGVKCFGVEGFRIKLPVKFLGEGTIDVNFHVAFAFVNHNQYVMNYAGAQFEPLSFTVKRAGRSGGPDSFGYTYLDSNTPRGPTYDWIEISGTGTEILPSSDDAWVGNINIGFFFNYYGTDYSQLAIGNNGLLFSGAGTWQYINQPITQTPDIHGFIAPYWDDIVTWGSAGAIYYQTIGTAPNRKFVVEWYRNGHYHDSSEWITFEAILYEGTNNILFQYQDVTFGTVWGAVGGDNPPYDYGGSATVGIEDPTGNIGLQYSFNEQAITPGLAILFKFPAFAGTNMHLSMNVPASMDRGNTMTCTLYYNNFGDVAASNVVLQATLSPNVNFVSASDGGTYDPGTRRVTWNIGTVQAFPLGRGSRTITVTISASVPIGTVIQTTASISTSTLETRYDDNTATAQTTVTGSNLPPNVSVGPTVGTVGGVPSVYWRTPITFTYYNPTAISVNIGIHLDDGGPDITGSMTGGPPTWTYTVTFYPRTGHATVTYTVNDPTPYSADFNLRNMRGFESTITAAEIENYIRSLTPTSPMLTEAGIGQRFIDAGRNNNVNPAFLVATAQHESVFGTQGWAATHPNAHNAMGWGIYEGHMDEDWEGLDRNAFTSWGDSIAHVAWRIGAPDGSYYGAGHYTVSEVRTVYAGEPAIQTIVNYMNALAQSAGQAGVFYENFNIYVDPAGYIYDITTGERISGATVWLQRPDGQGEWENVPTGQTPPIMQPDVNPQITGPDGQYQWDVLEGTYRVHVEAPGYYPADSIVVTVPPPVTDLHVGLTPLPPPPDPEPPTTTLTIGNPKYIDLSSNIYVTSDTPFTLSAEDNVGGSGVATTGYQIRNATYNSGWITSAPPIEFYLTGLADGTYIIDHNSTDNAGNIETTHTTPVTLDNSGSQITLENPPEGWALQDGVTFIVQATDSSGICSLNFSIREANGDQGIPVGLEDMPATYNTTTGKWELFFNTLQLPDGFYIVIVSAEDNLGHTAAITVPYSIRNWAVLELLPATPNNKAGRTMPVKFALRVAASVDPNQPFVYNEELTIKIYATDNPSNILQTSTFGDTARDYRINTTSEHYITNFQTLKTPKTYTVEIWRKNMLIGSFNFKTVK